MQNSNCRVCRPRQTAKKVISLVLSLVMLLTITAGVDLSAYADDATSGTCGDNLTWSYDTETCTLTISGTGAMTNYSASSYGNSYVTTAPWKKYYDLMKSLIIEDSVTSIGANAFYHCFGLSNITIGNSVTSIGSNAFNDCFKLTSISIPESVTNIHWCAFQYCSSLESVYINNLKAWCNIYFDKYDCSNPLYYAHNLYLKNELVTNLDIPNTVTRIEDYAFCYCTSLTSVTIPDSVTYIGTYSPFAGCTEITDINVDESNTEYSSLDGNLYNKKQTELIQYATGKTDECFTTPDSVTRIGSNAFSGCTELTSVTISDSVTSIGSDAFERCTGLTGVTIGNSVAYIGVGAFEYCTGLTSVTIPDSVTSIRDSAFEHCTGLTSVTIGNSVKTFGSYAFEGCTGLPSVTIGNSVTSIGNGAFGNCTGLTSITIPNSVTNIYDYAFRGCNSLADVYYNGTEEQWKDITIGTYNECLTRANIHCIDSIIDSGTCGDNLTWSLDGSGKLTITGTGDMYNYAQSSEEPYSNYCGITYPWYKYYDLIKTVIVEDGATSVGDYAFNNLTNMASIILPASIKNIGKNAFDNSTAIENIYYVGAQPEWNKINISTGNDNLTNIFYDYCANSANLKHKYGIDLAEAPTCTEPGYTTHNCTICDYGYCDNYVDAEGHNYTITVTQPTCTEKGYTTHTCIECGDTYIDNYVEALGHLSVTDDAVAPTCTKTGLTEGSHCSRCNETLVAQQTVNALGHNYVSTVTAPTCTTDGYTTYVCSRCNDTYTGDIVKANGHTPAQAVKENIVDATCTTNGSYDSVIYCSICNAEISRTPTTVEALGHISITDEAVAPTCTKTGLTEGTHCSRCSETLVAQQTVNALGHNYVSTVTAPTCTADGYTTYVCSRCNDTYTGDIVKANGHTPAQAVKENIVDATCTTNGSYDSVIYCSICNAEISREKVTTEKLLHNFDKIDVAPTCIAKGYTLYICKDCNSGYVVYTADATNIHSYKSAITTQPTCTTTGVTTYTCTVCGDSYTQPIEKLNHTEVTDEAIEPTCTKSGLTEGSHCSVCGKVLTAQQVVNAKGHTPISANNALAPTCTTAGKESDTICSVCGETISKGKTINAIGHNYIQTDVESTCEKAGYTLNTCSDCGESYKSDYKPLAQHTYNTVITLQPTCTAQGKSKSTCIICGETHYNVVDANGHTAVIDKAVAATYYATGKTQGSHCSVCGAIITAQKTVAKLTLATPAITLTAQSKAIKVTYKKITGATGYQIQYSTSSNFTSYKSIKTTSLSYTVKSLTAKKKYYVRVRAYHTESGKGTVYSSWSSKKSVTTKK